MQQFQSLKRLLVFYTLTLLIMLTLYYVMMFLNLKTNSQHYSQTVFRALQHEVTEHEILTDTDLAEVLNQPFFVDISYQIILMSPSGQTYIHRYTRLDQKKFTVVSFPSSLLSSNDKQNRAIDKPYQLTNYKLTGIIKLKSGHQLYVLLRHQPVTVNWLSYQYWLPLMTAILMFFIALMYTFKRRKDWQQLLQYTENLTTSATEAYITPSFDTDTSAAEFLRLGHTLSRVSYQLHNDHRRIKTLSHRLERLVDHAPLPMLMIMRQGQISFVNQRFKQVFAASFQHHTNDNLTDFFTGSDKTTQLLLQKLSSERVKRTLLVYGLEDDQAYQLHITPWFGEHEQVHGFTILVNNVDNLVTQTNDIRLENQQLQLQIKEFTQLRSIIGHELRTPLSAIIGTLDLIEVSQFSLEQQEVLSMLKRSSDSMLAMLNDMLDVAKIEAGKAQIVNESTDIFKLGQHVSDLMAGSARQQELELLYLFMPDCPRSIMTDGNRLQQILLNLLNNAVKFTKTGYVALVIEPMSQQQIAHIRDGNSTSKPQKDDLSSASSINKSQINTPIKPFARLNQDLASRVAFKDSPEGLPTQHSWIRFSIKDTGIGILDTEQHELFSHFNQANDKISRKFGGTGLGLAISNSFAQLLGGFIQLDSDGHSGSTFALYLPCLQPTYQPAYHFQDSLTSIYLIAIVQHTLCVNYLQQLCQHLSIEADIYTVDNLPNIDKLTEKLARTRKTLAPILLLDSEYSSISSQLPADDSIVSFVTADKSDDGSNEPVHKPSNQAYYRYLDNLLAIPSLPKILLSMKSERGISSTYLAKFDGFLSKPLNMTLLLSEFIRLTQPKPLTQSNLAAQNIIDKKDESLLANEKTVIKDNRNQSESKESVILVAEDNLTNQKIVCKLLQRLGYQSIIAQNGQHALEQLTAAQQPIALILMDCRMPVMDGMQATRAIRAQGNKIPIVALTANNSAEDREACYEAGMNEFLAKPIQKKQLADILQRFADK